MTNVRVLSTSVVQAKTTIPKRLELTPFDLRPLLLGPIQKGLLFPKPGPSATYKFGTALVQHLKSSLSCTLDFFFPLAGRLATVEYDDNTISVFIDCNNLGAQFVHAVAHETTIANILEPTYVPSIVQAFFPLNGIKNYEGVSKPLLGVQVTELVDGIFIGCTVNHSVVDGTSLWNFFNSWSEISRGFDHISKPPVFERGFNSSYSPIRVPLSLEKINDLEFTPRPLQNRVFHFTKDKIAGLKSKANGEVKSEKISSLQSILDHVWRSVIRSREVNSDEQETIFHLVIGTRSRIHLPEQYFRNAYLMERVTLKEKELLEHGLGYAALQMNKAVVDCTEEKIRSNLESWIENPQFSTLVHISTNGLSTSSSPRFNVYGNDFGWGRPVAVRSGSANKFDGKITLFPGVEEGSVDVELCVSSKTLQGMANDLEFMNAFIV